MVNTFFYIEKNILFDIFRDFVKSVGLFAVAIYIIRDLASNDLLPME